MVSFRPQDLGVVVGPLAKTFMAKTFMASPSDRGWDPFMRRLLCLSGFCSLGDDFVWCFTMAELRFVWSLCDLG